MRFYFDESGRFQIPRDPEEHRAAVVVGVTIPESAAAAVNASFAKFKESLIESELQDGEPKGWRLTEQSRRAFATMLRGHPDVLLTPVTLDLSSLAPGFEGSSQLATSLRKRAEGCIHQTMRDDMEELAKLVSELSSVELLRLLAWTEAFQEAIHHAVAYLSEGSHTECWGSVEFFVDSVGPEGSRDKRVFEFMVMSWLAAWSKQRPLVTINEVHTDDHPFVKNFAAGEKFDIGKLIRNNIRWVNSRDHTGIQIADIVASIVHHAVHDLQNHRNTLPVFADIMANCRYSSADGPGFIVLKEATSISEGKYSGLCRLIAARYPHRSGRFRGLRRPPAMALPKPNANE